MTLARARGVLSGIPEWTGRLRDLQMHIQWSDGTRTIAEMSRVFAEAARLKKAIEIDCYPDRQDLNLALLRKAKREGTLISLGTDAHHPW